MRHLAMLAFGAIVAACVTPAQTPPNFELTWVKPHVAFEIFVADVEVCNAIAEAAGRAVEPRRDDASHDLSPPMLAWRWLAHGADVDAAMAGAYETCFGPRGYSLAYVTEADARHFRDIGVADAHPGEGSSQKREDQLHFLHRLATTGPPLRARIEARQQRRPLLSYVAPQ